MVYRRTHIQSVLPVVLFAALAFTLLISQAGTASAQEPGEQGLTVIESDQSFEETWAALAEALQANENIQVLGQIDHASAASIAGLDLDPNRVVFFGNPALGTPLMEASRSAALDLPQKIQVYEVDGTAYVAYNSADYLGARHAAADIDTLPTIAGALANFSAAGTGLESAIVADATSIMAGEGVDTKISENTFEQTWDNLVGAIESSPANLAFTVDHGENSGGALRPTRLAIFGNPAIGTPLMNDNPTIGIDLPLKIVVWEDFKGNTKVSSTDPSFLANRHNIGGATDSLSAAATALNNFVAAATAADDNGASGGDSGTDDSAGADDGSAAGGDGDDDDKKADLPQTGRSAAPILIGAFLLMAGGIFLLTGDRLEMTEG